MKTKAEIESIINEVAMPGTNFVLLADEGEEGRLFLQIQYLERCVETGEIEPQHGRKWFISRHATKGEIVQTALKAALTSAEHRVREHFTYRGRAVFGPHFNIDVLWELAGDPKDKRG